MKVSDVIIALEEGIATFGDVDVYVNGEHGVECCDECSYGEISFGEAYLLIDHDRKGVDATEIICHIGGV